MVNSTTNKLTPANAIVLKITRTSFLKFGIPVMAAGIGGVGYSTLIEPQQLSLERIAARLPNLPAALEGLRIAILSDFHLHPFTKLPQIEDAIQLSNSIRPDIVVLLGDYVDAYVEAIDELAPSLSKLNSRFGVFGVLGNHDYWKGARIVRETLQGVGILMMENTGTAISIGGSELFLAGLESAWAGRPDLEAAMQGSKADATIVLLVHEPDYADISSKDPRITLQLSGHSHGGQIRLPLIGALELPSWGSRYDAGLYQIRNMTLYTNRGIGVVDIPVRFNCLPEVTEVTLHRG